VKDDGRINEVVLDIEGVRLRLDGCLWGDTHCRDGGAGGWRFKALDLIVENWVVNLKYRREGRLNVKFVPAERRFEENFIAFQRQWRANHQFIHDRFLSLCLVCLCLVSPFRFKFFLLGFSPSPLTSALLL
jgi:hypothetical protein